MNTVNTDKHRYLDGAVQSIHSVTRVLRLKYFRHTRSWRGIAAGVLTPSTPAWKTRIVMPCQSASAEQTHRRPLLDCVGQEPLAFSANPLVAMSFSNDRRY